jgi:prepilin signal peptidase PulO-like enzyme (type II secretory pathway)
MLGRTVSVAMLLGMLAAFVPAMYLLVRHGAAARKTKLPFGPFLALGGVIALFWGPQLLSHYWSLFHLN